jgi:hypothetical protein
MAEPYTEECVVDECRSPAARIAQDLRDPLTGTFPSEAPLGKLSRVLRARSGHFGTKYLPASSLLIAESSAGRISASPCGLRVGSLACTSTLDKTDFQKSGCLACRKVENYRVLCPGAQRSLRRHRSCLLRDALRAVRLCSFMRPGREGLEKSRI